MNEPAMNAFPPFRPPFVSPRAASVFNALLRCTDSEGLLVWPENSVRLRLLSCPQPFMPSVWVGLRWFGGLWTVEIGGLDIARVHPLLKELPPEADLPEALRLAALDTLVLGALDTLGTLGGSPQSEEYGFAAQGTAADPDVSCQFLWLEVMLPDGPRFPMRVGLPEGDTPVQAMLSTLTTAAGTRKSVLPGNSTSLSQLAELTVAVAVETGAMRLSPAQCRELAVGDILLPDDYPARENRVRLVFEARRPMPVLHCAVCGLAATVELLTLPPEDLMTDSTFEETPEAADVAAEEPGYEENRPDRSAASASSISVPDMDLAVSFELERRLLTVAEVADLRPGHTFTLSTDPLAPVTIRVQGKAVGIGRLVDLGGALGVQITAIS